MKCLIVITAIGFLSSSAFAQWSIKPSGTMQNLHDVMFVNNQVGYCVGDNGTILKTTNEGENWTSVFSIDTNDFNAVYFKDESTGWICGSKAAYQTSNGGTTFTSIEPLFGNTNPSKQLIYSNIMGAKGDIVIISAMYAEIPQTSPASYYRIITRDGGITWQSYNYPGGGYIQIVNNSVFYAADFMIRKTVDGGNSWIDMDGGGLAFPPINRSTFKIIDVNGNGWASLMYHIESVKIDALSGNSVTVQSSPDVHIYSASFPSNQNKGYFLRSEGDNQTRVYTSVDAGTSFSLLSNQSVNANAICFVNNSVGFLCGNNGNIYKTTAGDVSISESNSEFPSLFRIYPNPSSEKITLEKQGDVSIEEIRLTDISGKTVRTFSTTESVIDVSGIARGIYMVSIKTNGKNLNQKIVIH